MNQIIVEYGLLIALISMILIILLGTAGEEVNQIWSKINSGISR
jgi:Flp pilus assembly pilin Flp